MQARLRLAQLDAEHGEDRARAIGARFDARRHVEFSSWWSMARHDVVALHHDGLRASALEGEEAVIAAAELDAVAAHLAASSVDPAVSASAKWFRDRAAERGDVRAATRFDTILAGGRVATPVPSVRPSVSIDPDGELVVEEVASADDRPSQLIDQLAATDLEPEILAALRSSLVEAGDMTGEVALITGASPGGIAFEVVRRLLGAGATVICTTTTLTPERLADYRELYRTSAVPGAELHVVPANMASFADVDDAGRLDRLARRVERRWSHPHHQGADAPDAGAALRGRWGLR